MNGRVSLFRAQSSIGKVEGDSGFEGADVVKAGVFWLVVRGLGKASIDLGFEGPYFIDLGVAAPNRHGRAV
jgi:hypothetical protein